MKKLLVLSLVLSAASLATAGWGFTVNETNTAASIQGDYLGADLTYCITSGNPIVIALGAGAPDASGYLDTADNLGITGVPAGVMAEVWSVGSFSTIANRVGVDMFQLSGLVAPDTISIYLVDDVNGAMGELVASVTLIPEPMTMGLLGLGALFLRKR